MSTLRSCKILTLFPAHAGVIPPALPRMIHTTPFPRTRGGDPDFVKLFSLKGVFSPHTRG